MESLQQRREELERKEQQLKDSLLKFDKFLKVQYASDSIMLVTVNIGKVRKLMASCQSVTSSSSWNIQYLFIFYRLGHQLKFFEFANAYFH